MTNYNNNSLELATDLAHNQLVKDYRDIYSEEELQDNKNPEIYKDEVQDSFNDLYDYFLNKINKAFELYFERLKEDKDSLEEQINDLNFKLSNLEEQYDELDEDNSIFKIHSRNDTIDDEYKMKELQRIFDKYDLRELEKL